MATHAIRVSFDITNDDMMVIERVTGGKQPIEDWLYANMVTTLERMEAYKEV